MQRKIGTPTTRFPTAAALVALAAAVIIAGCSNAGAAGGGSDGSDEDAPGSPGGSTVFSAAGVTWTMRYVPGKSTFTENDDAGSATVNLDFLLGETEVTYELRRAVYDWAVNSTGSADGEGAYSFANPGREGHDGSEGAAPTSADQEPVTDVNWRDAMAWTNALTEWYNAQTGSALEPVYYSDSSFSAPIRSVTDSSSISYESGPGANDGSQDDPYVKADADGFRLPGINEWELAARFIEDTNADGDIMDPGEYYPGSYASGADARYDASSAASDVDGDGDQDTSSDVAWYGANSGSTTHPVSTKEANALGFHDMSGNVWEWNFDWISEGISRGLRGSSWSHQDFDLPVGYVETFGNPYDNDDTISFRIAKSSD